jgi:phage gp45-like
MPLDAYSPPTYRIRDSRASRVVLEANTSSQTDETGLQVSGPREVHQEGEIDHAQHWGFSSRPPQGTELVQILDEYGRVVVAERVPCPVALVDGDACLWTSATNFVRLKADKTVLIQGQANATIWISANGAVAVRSPTGQDVSINSGDDITVDAPDLVVVTAGDDLILSATNNAYLRSSGGGTVELGGGGVVKSVAREKDPVTADNTMAAWLLKAQAVLVAHDPTIVAPTDFGYIDSGSLTTKCD